MKSGPASVWTDWEKNTLNTTNEQKAVDARILGIDV